MASTRTMLWRLAGCVGAIVLAAACDEQPQGTLTIVSGSENRSLEPIVAEFCADQGWSRPMTYLGSVDIRLALEEGTFEHDAVWPAHTRWVEMGDRERRVKHLRSIMQSPVVFGILRSEAERLGLADRPVTTTELVQLVADGDLRFIMTSATQSNSGFSAYIAMLTTLAGAPEVLTSEMLSDPALRQEVRTLLSGVQRTAGSSGWLAALYLEGADSQAYRAMVNYEALLIETSEALDQRGLEPLYAVYPADGIAVADSPLGFVASDGAGAEDAAEKEAFFLELQAYLLSAGVQQRLLALGRRTGFGGVVEDADPDIFRPAWGIDAAAATVTKASERRR